MAYGAKDKKVLLELVGLSFNALNVDTKSLSSFLELFNALVDQLLHVLEACVALVLDGLDLDLQDTGLLLDHLLGFVAAWHVVYVGMLEAVVTTFAHVGKRLRKSNPRAHLGREVPLER